MQQRVSRHRGTGDNISSPHRLFQIFGNSSIFIKICKGHRPAKGTVPDKKRGIGESHAISFTKRVPDGACPNDQDRSTVWARQTFGGVKAVTCGFPFGYEMKINDCLKHTIIIRKQTDRTVDHWVAFRRVSGEYCGRFDCQSQSVNPS